MPSHHAFFLWPAIDVEFSGGLSERWGRVFTGHMTQPTVSEHRRKIGPKDWASIPSGPPHCAHIDTTTMQYETKTHKIHTDKHK